MTQDRLIELLRRRRSANVLAERCPPDDALAAYIDGTLDPGALTDVESHVAGCAVCRGAVAQIVRLDATESTDLPDLLVARARRIGAPAKARRFGVARAWAAAATVLLAVGLLALNRGELDPMRDIDAPTTRGERYVDQRALPPEITAPAPDALIDVHDFAVHWKAVPGARYYDVRIVDDDGDLVREARVDGTDWTPPPLDLVAGADYFVRVDAYVDSAKPRSSAHVPFRVTR